MTIRARALKVITDHLGVDDPSMNERLYDDLGADSLDVIEITLELEVEFEIEISDEDGDAADTVGKLLDLVERLTARSGRAF